jgi:hypothetical protein
MIHQHLEQEYEVIAISGRRASGELIRCLACVDCGEILAVLPICGTPTLKRKPCRTPIRMDLGYRSCWTHPERRGRTSTPREVLA